MKHTFERSPGAALVRTGSGAVRGYLHDGLAVFKGIPYARAARFHAPEAVPPWAGEFDACSYG